MSIEIRLEIQIIDKIEQQVQHCLREYENDLLEDKLIDLVKEWFFKGFSGGVGYQQGKEQKQRETHIMLDEEDFKCLVRGGVLKVGDLNLALRDIGFEEMNKALELAMDGINIHKDHIKQH